MKKIYPFLLALFAAGLTEAQPIVNITDADLTGGNTYNWTKTNVYMLEGTVFVEDGATLNIEQGTVIKFKPNVSGTDPSALIICRGAKIFATGTIDEPIIFTAEADDVNDPIDLGPGDNAQWGGIAILGKSKTVKNGNSEVNLEGIPTTEPRGIYGMPAGQEVLNDNSGIMRYCSIRHGGSALASGSELNGLSLGAVGSGTTLEYIDIYANSDDGIEFFGGTVNLKYASVSFVEDDSFDWDEEWTGKGQFWFAIQRADVADNGWECDGSTPDNTAPFSDPTVYNATIIGSGPGAAAANPTGWLLRAGTRGFIANSVVSELKNKALEVQDRPNNATTDAYSMLVAGSLELKNNIFWNCGTNSTIDISSSGIIRSTVTNGLGGEDSTCLFLINHLNTNSNTISNPGTISISRTQNQTLDPRVSVTGAAYTTPMASYPAGDPFFSQVNYKGAFSSETNWLGKWSSLSKNNHFDAAAGLNDFSVSNRMSIYPNPADAFIMLDFITERNTTLNIFNAEGRLVYTKFYSGSQHVIESVSVADLNAGLYLVQLQSNGETSSKRLIVK